MNTLVDIVRRALEEDVGPGDVTTRVVMRSSRSGEAVIVAREPVIVAGAEAARASFLLVDPRLEVRLLRADGQPTQAGEEIARVAGDVGAILTAERTALNFLQRLSGIATLTRRFADALSGTRCRLLDTRKTTPGLRWLEKAAVRAGGGHNHRFGLFDGILIKDNHLIAAGGVGAAVRLAREAAAPGLRVQVEVETAAQVDEALAAGAEALLLDNMTLEALAAAVRQVAGRAFLEASGGVRLENVADIAATGVDAISVGAITHSARAVDLSLELISQSETPITEVEDRG